MNMCLGSELYIRMDWKKVKKIFEIFMGPMARSVAE